MIPVAPVPEPEDFQARCGQPGREWRAGSPAADRPRDLWSPFRGALADGFKNLCGYSAMYSPVGTIDHYLSIKNHPELAYEWRNYRFAEALCNQAKGNADRQVLDPYEVGQGWFELHLPSLQLRLTDKVPAEERERAEFTLRRLPLRDDERILRQRRVWLALYESGELTLQGLARHAPLIAEAVAKRDNLPISVPGR